MTKYMAAGAFANITANKGQFDNSSHWLAGLKKSSMFNNKLFGVPYYAGSRLVTYRTDLFKKAGLKKAPKSLEQFESQLAKVKGQDHTKGFTPFYMAGTDWYSALSFVYDYGGSIANVLAWQVARGARLEEVDRGAQRLQEVLPRVVAASRRRSSTRRTLRRTRSSRRTGRRRSSGRAGSAAASARSTRRSPASS